MKAKPSECKRQVKAGYEAKDKASFIERRLFYLMRHSKGIQ